MQTLEEQLQKANERISELETKKANLTATYNLTTDTGWIRVAKIKIDNNYYNQRFGSFLIMNKASYGTLLKLECGDVEGYSGFIIEDYYKYINGKMFTQARINYKIGAEYLYLELYKAISYSRWFCIVQAIDFPRCDFT